ncbi:MAG: AtpZ/AtpI family protein, partial [Gemmatimonadaceae bacterium]|nr:AtpZ/AtpI family protein [Gemmatimonadaceae bacterium]
AGLGRWLDQRNPGGRSFTLALLVAGLCLGCMNAWHWIAREAAQTALDEDSATDAIHDEHKAVPRDR